MRRNESVLDFQRRLIRAALNSPRAESMKLMGIVYSNLVEFIQVRVPLDNMPDILMDEFVDVLDLLNSAIQRKFPGLYIANDPANIETAESQLLPDFDADPNAYYEALINLGLKIYHTEDGKLAPGIMNDDGMFYHRWIIDKLLLQHQKQLIEVARDKNLPIGQYLRCLDIEGDNVNIRGHRNRISAPPASVPGNQAAIATVNKWLTQMQDADKNYTVDVLLKNSLKSAQDEVQCMDCQVKNTGDPHHRLYVLNIRHPLIIEFDEVSKMILSDPAHQPPDEVKYEDSIEDMTNLEIHYDLSKNETDYGVTGSPYLGSNNGNYLKYFRTPMDDPLHFLKTLIGRIFPQSISSKFIRNDKVWNTLNSVSEIREFVSYLPKFPEATRKLHCAYMTIYRTGDIKKMDDQFLKFILIVGAYLKRDAHFVIECRARGDEANNIALARILTGFGCDVNVTQRIFYMNKIHAKIWSFGVSVSPITGDVQYQMFDVFSTGNFSMANHTSFSDSIILRLTVLPNRTIEFIPRFWRNFSNNGRPYLKYIESDDKYYDDPNLIFDPSDIKKTIINEINALTAPHAAILGDVYRPFIMIKCNHIIDPEIIAHLCAAAASGVDVRVMVRTTCTIPTKVMYRHLQVRSIVGKYLEHDRMYIFGYDSAEEGRHVNAYISSADLMPRNLERRLEFMYRCPNELGLDLMELFTDMFSTESRPNEGYFNYPLK